MFGRSVLLTTILLALVGCGGATPGKKLEKKSKAVVISVARQEPKVIVKVTVEGSGETSDVEMPAADWDALKLKSGDLCDLLDFSVVTVEKTKSIQTRSKDDSASNAVPPPQMINPPPVNFR